MEPAPSLSEELAALQARLAPHHLEILGTFPPKPEDNMPDWVKSVALLGLTEPGFWPHFTAEPEWQDGQADPMDRWSRRVIGQLACDMGTKAWFPFGGPPYHPFYQWALRTGRVWESPVRLLVHSDQGLLVSFRGALALRHDIQLPKAEHPCQTCPRPCLTACPAKAMSAQGYDVPACHSFLDGKAGQECLSAGCIARRACPVSQGYARLPEQSAYHMGRFHKAK